MNPEVLISPTKATTVFPLPAEFASAWSPGFDLHVSGQGATADDATAALVQNLRDLATRLLGRADRIEKGAS